MRAILIDIEGTTTPISFVYEVLFPFAAERLEETCGRAADDRELAAAVEQLRTEYERETDGDVAVPEFGDGSPYARLLMQCDRKSGGLKALQGLIWRAGYESGELRGEVFADVPVVLGEWRRLGLRLRVYSSGSVLAQKLLFSTTIHGDLTRHFEGFHDTAIGPKLETGSYRAIARAFGLPPEEILFLSDVVPELDAARGAGMATGLLERPGNKPAATDLYPKYRSFEEIEIRDSGSSRPS